MLTYQFIDNVLSWWGTLCIQNDIIFQYCTYVTFICNVFSLLNTIKHISKFKDNGDLRAHSLRASKRDSGGNSWTIARRGPLGMRWRTCGSVAWPSALSSGAPVWTCVKVNVLSGYQSLYSWNYPGLSSDKQQALL